MTVDTQEVYDLIEAADLHGEWKDIAGSIGIDAVRVIMRNFGGAELYVPVKPPQDAVKRYAKMRMRQGYSLTQIANELHIKRRTLQDWVLKTSSAKITESQLVTYSMFEEE